MEGCGCGGEGDAVCAVEDYEEFGLGGEEKREGGFVFCFWFRQVGWNQAERYHLVDVMQNIYTYIWMVGMLSSVLHYTLCTHVLANEPGDEAFFDRLHIWS